VAQLKINMTIIQCILSNIPLKKIEYDDQPEVSTNLGTFFATTRSQPIQGDNKCYAITISSESFESLNQ